VHGFESHDGCQKSKNPLRSTPTSLLKFAPKVSDKRLAPSWWLRYVQSPFAMLRGFLVYAPCQGCPADIRSKCITHWDGANRSHTLTFKSLVCHASLGATYGPLGRPASLASIDTKFSGASGCPKRWIKP
jgi:hypothetical protein